MKFKMESYIFSEFMLQFSEKKIIFRRVLNIVMFTDKVKIVGIIRYHK